MIIVFGVLYEVINLRKMVSTPFLDEIDKNIMDLMLERSGFSTDMYGEADFRGLNKRILNVFYRIVDGDPSLIEKSKIVKFNGAILSFFFDCVVISFGFCIFYLALSFIMDDGLFFLLVYLFLGLSSYAIYYFLIPLVVSRHVDFGRDQVDFMAVNMKSDLETRVREVVSGL